MTMQVDKARLDELIAALRTIIECNDEGPGLIDCIDNDGERYTSQGLDDAIKLGRQALESDALRSLRSTEGKEGERTGPFEFDRYVDGVLMAEGVTIEDAKTLEMASRKAAKIACRGPNGESPVLVLIRPVSQAEVSEQMLERANAAFSAAKAQWQLHPDAPLSMMPSPMRAALTAALSSGGDHGVR